MNTEGAIITDSNISVHWIDVVVATPFFPTSEWQRVEEWHELPPVSVLRAL